MTSADDSNSPAASGSSPQPGMFTIFDLIYLVIRDGCLAACVVVGWLAGGWCGAAAAVPAGWLIGWIMQYAAAFVMALILKLLIGGPDRPPGETDDPSFRNPG